jgi:hypothetical protein
MTDYRSELQALVDVCESFAVPIRGQRIPWQTALDRARTALAEPEPEGPTVMEIIELADEIEESGLGQVDLVRAALARWGNNTSRSN